MAIAVEKMLAGLRTAPELDRELGEQLFGNGTLSEQDFKRVLAAQREGNECFGDAVLRLGMVTERQLRQALAKQCEQPATVPDESTFSRELLPIYRPNGAHAEAIRNLRSELMLRWFNHGQRMLLVSEARRNQGADVLAANLAWSLAQLGQRTILVDANLRSGEQDSLFRMDAAGNVADFLRGQCSLQDAVTLVPSLTRLSVMFSGQPAANAQELLSLDSFSYMLNSLQKNFDKVIIVGPAILEFADAQQIAACSAGYILNIQRHRTRIADVEAAKSRLAPTAAASVGVVLEG